VRELLQRCLEKDPTSALRDSGDVRIELERALEAREWTSTGALSLAAEGSVASRRMLPWAIAGLAVSRRSLDGDVVGAGARSRRSRPGGAPHASPCTSS
jgi:hypothetical protein